MNRELINALREAKNIPKSDLLIDSVKDRNRLLSLIDMAANELEKTDEDRLIIDEQILPLGKPGYFRIVYTCPNCKTELGHMSYKPDESKADKIKPFGASSILKDNVMPKYCPECGTHIRYKKGS